MFTSMAISLLRTAESWATPCSLKAKGIYRMPPLFEVLKLHLKLSNSSFVSSNIKSEGKRRILFLTERFRYFVSIPYSSAKSKSSITRCPRISYILLWMVCSWFMAVVIRFIYWVIQRDGGFASFVVPYESADGGPFRALCCAPATRQGSGLSVRVVSACLR